MIHESELNCMTDYDAPVLLRAFLDSKKPLTQAAAAEQIGIVPSALTAYLKRTQRPRSDIRQRIAKWSDGAVPEAAWLTAKEQGAVDGVDVAVTPDPVAEPPDAEAPSKNSQPPVALD